MADAKQCDRCGKFYKNNTILHDEGSFITRIFMADDNHILEKYDLCDECIRKFQDFMKGDNK